MLKKLYKTVNEWFCQTNNPPRWTKEKFMAELDASEGQEADFSGCSGIVPLEQAMRMWPSAHTQEELAWYVEWLQRDKVKFEYGKYGLSVDTKVKDSTYVSRSWQTNPANKDSVIKYEESGCKYFDHT